MLQRILSFARENGVPRSGETYLVGVSGGADSVALLDALRELAPLLQVNLHVVHLDHGLRGAESAADAEFVASLAGRMGLPVTVGKVEVLPLAAERRLSVETAARQARYAFFAEAATSTKAAGVFVAHTADDQVETVLQHLLRGTGISGLRGMPAVQSLALPGAVAGEVSGILVLRPLLAVWRAEVNAFVAERGLLYRDDPSNRDRRYLRNRIRHQLVPLLETYNPGLRPSLLQLANLASADYAVLSSLTDRAWAELVEANDGVISLLRRGFANLEVAIQRLLLRRAFAALVGGVEDLEAKHVEAARALAVGESTVGRLHLPSGVVVTRAYDDLLVSVGEQSAEPLPESGVALVLPGTTTVEPGGWVAIAEVGNAPCASSPEYETACFDLDRVGLDLVVRRRRPGDRLRPVGLGGSKKLQDIMVDRKVPRWQRDAVPIVASRGQVLWAVGLAMDESGLPSDDTKRYLCLRFGRRGSK